MDPGIREVFLNAGRRSLELLRSPEVDRSWERASVLAEFSVRGLAGHLARAAGFAVETYLDADEPRDDRILDAAGYYTAVLPSRDIADPVNVDVRTRGEDLAKDGHAALVERLAATLERLGPRLSEEPAERIVRVFGDVAMRLDDYLVTRLVEVVVHCDDLALSVGLPTPPFDTAAVDVAIDGMLAIARRHHGDLAVIRALARRERDDVQALRVF